VTDSGFAVSEVGVQLDAEVDVEAFVVHVLDSMERLEVETDASANLRQRQVTFTMTTSGVSVETAVDQLLEAMKAART
jgi:hypothetical protein